MTRIGRRVVVLGVVLSLGLGGAVACDKATPLDCICTEEFRSFTTVVIDGTGAPVEGMSVSVTRTRDGYSYPAGQDLGFSAGTYVILDDGAIDEVGQGGEAIEVVASKDGTSVAANYVFATDGCRCHVSKVSGPDTLVWGVGT